MPIRERLAIAISDSFLGGSWTADGLLTRAQSVFVQDIQRQWLRELVDRVLMAFPATSARPTQRHLQEYVAAQAVIPKPERVPGTTRFRRRIQSWQSQMQPADGAAKLWSVPALVTIAELAAWFEITVGELEWFANRTGWNTEHSGNVPAKETLGHYRYRWLAKPSGGQRLLETPKPRLKSLQRKILTGILNHVPAHRAAHAFRRGRSVATYLSPHAGQQVVLHIDLREFFPSVHASRVHAAFRTMGYPERIAGLLTGLCTNDTPSAILYSADGQRVDEGTWLRQRAKHLPQGAPTSPALANLCAYKLDCRLEGLARTVSAQYTRYADDLVFSGEFESQKSLARLRILINAIILDEGFEIRHRKTQVMPAGTRQQVAGVRLNVHPNIPREAFDELKAILHNCWRYGPGSQNRTGHPNFRDHLNGRLAYWSSICPVRIVKLQEMFDRIEWTEQ
jgi:RNA-directed DNA polymerase